MPSPNANPKTMRAIQLTTPGPPSNLQLVDLPVPVPQPGQVLLRVKAFGLNRSELLTRKFGRAPVGPVTLPRVLGVEAVGLIESAPDHSDAFPIGSVAMTAVGGMGVTFDGGYAEFCCVSAENVQLIHRQREGVDVVEALGWEILGAQPELLQTAHGSLFRSLRLQAGETVLIRGGTTSVGLAAASIAKGAGATVLATTRKGDLETGGVMRENGVEHVIVDDCGSVRKQVMNLVPGGVDKVLELVGGSTLQDSISCLAKDGVCCMTGLVGGAAGIESFNPLALLHTERYLTAYGERTFKPENLPLDELIGQVMEGKLKVRVGKVFRMEEIVEAHELMESNQGNGKIVVVTGM